MFVPKINKQLCILNIFELQGVVNTLLEKKPFCIELRYNGKVLAKLIKSDMYNQYLYLTKCYDKYHHIIYNKKQ